MHPADIKAELGKKNISAAKIATELSVSRTAVYMDAPRRFFRRKVGGFGRVCHLANCTDFVKIQLPYFDEPPLVGS